MGTTPASAAMPETPTFSVQTAVAGTQYIQNGSVTANGVERRTPTLAAAKVGTLTTRTDDNTGTFTMVTGHGFITSDVVDVFWSGGSRRGMTATVTGDSAVLDGGSGDVLPIATTGITAMEPTEEAFAADATATGVCVVAACPVNGYVVFRDASDVVLYTCQIRAGYLAVIWVTGMGANPLVSAAVANVLFSHGDSTQSQTLTAAVVY